MHYRLIWQQKDKANKKKKIKINGEIEKEKQTLAKTKPANDLRKIGKIMKQSPQKERGRKPKTYIFLITFYFEIKYQIYKMQVLS